MFLLNWNALVSLANLVDVIDSEHIKDKDDHKHTMSMPMTNSIDITVSIEYNNQSPPQMEQIFLIYTKI